MPAIVAIALSQGLVGCSKKPPPDPQLAEGYRLLLSDPQKAYERFEKARDGEDPRVLLGRGLALEGMRKYPEAEQALERARAVANVPAVWLALARVELMLGKVDSARRNVDAVVAKAPSDLSALLLETCLANDEPRARSALGHLKAWPGLQAGKKTTSNPAEYHLALASILSQLQMSTEMHQAQAAAKRAPVANERDALALVALATKANRLDLVVGVLRRLVDGSPSTTALRQVATVAHALGAHDLVERALSLIPSAKRGPALIRLSAEHEYAMNRPKAVLSLREALGVAETPEARAQIWLMLGDALLRSGAVDEARKEAEALLREQPGHAGASVLLARVDLATGHETNAIDRLKPLLAASPPPGAHEVAALAWIQTGSPDKAFPHLEAVLERQPTHPLAVRLLVAQRLKLGQTREALDAVTRLVKRAPEHVGLRLLLADLVRKTRGAGAAQATLRTSVDSLPREPRLWLALAAEHRRNKEGEAALAVLKEGHEKNPGDLSLTAGLAAQLAALQHSEQAAPLYAEVLRQSEGNVAALNNLAMLEADHLGNAEKAVGLAEEAYRLAPSQPAIADTLGWALLKRGKASDLPRARQLIESASSQLNSPTSKFHLGMVLMATGNKEAGRRLVEQALAMPGDFPEAEQARSALSG